MNEHKSQAQLRQEIEESTNVIAVGALYSHYKDPSKTYTVTGLGFLEATDELCVIYQASYGERITFVRPLAIWKEQVEWQGKAVPRFSKL